MPKAWLSLWEVLLGKVALAGDGLSSWFGAWVPTLLSCHFLGTLTHNGVFASPYLLLRIDIVGF